LVNFVGAGLSGYCTTGSGALSSPACKWHARQLFTGFASAAASDSVVNTTARSEVFKGALRFAAG
jgi:hypothetical protein